MVFRFENSHEIASENSLERSRPWRCFSESKVRLGAARNRSRRANRETNKMKMRTWRSISVQTRGQSNVDGNIIIRGCANAVKAILRHFAERWNFIFDRANLYNVERAAYVSAITKSILWSPTRKEKKNNWDVILGLLDDGARIGKDFDCDEARKDDMRMKSSERV